MKSYSQCCRVILIPNRIRRKDRTLPFCSKHQAPILIQWDILALPSTTQAVSVDELGDSSSVEPSGCFPQQKQVARDWLQFTGTSTAPWPSPLPQGAPEWMKKPNIIEAVQMRGGLWCPKVIESLYRWKKRMWNKKTLLSSFSAPGLSYNLSNSFFLSQCSLYVIFLQFFRFFLDRYTSPYVKRIPG